MDLEQKLESEIVTMLEKGIVEKMEPSQVSWCFPFFWTRETTRRKGRSAVDFRRLNPNLVYEEIDFPTSEEIIDDIKMPECYYSKLDLAKAYHQIRTIDPENALVIRIKSGYYKFKVIPLRISTAMAMFQKRIEQF